MKRKKLFKNAMECCMIDVGIISINIHSLYLNYGAALHSFAFQKYLESLGINSVIVDYKSKHFGNMLLDRPAITFLKRHKRITTILSALLNTPSFKRKYKTFNAFYSANCKMVDNNGEPYTYDFFNKQNEKINFVFPIVVCESDVIWSPKTSNGFDRVFFCDYPCFKNKIKVAYAPSISNTHLTKTEEEKFKKLLENFDYLSSREKQTAEYVNTITGRKCVHVLDPVLLLDEKDYVPYFEEQKFSKYLLVYNVMRNDKKMLLLAKKIAKKRNLKLIEISDYVRNKIDHKTLTGRSIGEFLWLIKNSDYFITNGFHGVCFSILFKKDFLVFERDGVDLKVKSLLESLKLEDCFVFQSQIDSYIDNYKKIDWENVFNLLNIQRKDSMHYINESIVNNIRGGTFV